MDKRIAVVTGAGTGIGFAVSKKLMSLEYRVVGIGRRTEKLNQAARLFENDPNCFVPISVDVRNLGALERELADIDSIDLLIANAGIVRQARLGDPGCDEVWKEIISINLDGVWNTLRAGVPLIKDGGRVVVVSSGLGKLGRPGFSAYCASKHGVLGLVKCVSKELASRKITVNAVCPGWVKTEMAESDVKRYAKDRGLSVAKVEEEIEANIPLGRFVQPEEVADLICWLASDQASAITGEAYNISGGEFFA